MDVMATLVVVAAAAAAIALFNGVFSMAHGGEADRRNSARFMWQRVAWQAVAFALVLIAIVATRFTG